MGKAVSGLFITLFFFTLIAGIHYGLFALLSQTRIFSVRTITVSGNIALNTEDILRQCGIQKGDDIFGFDLKVSERNLRSHPYIEKAVIRRLPPDTVEIEIVERSPLAYISDGTNSYLCDKDAAVLSVTALSGIIPITVDFPLTLEGGHITDEAIKVLLTLLGQWKERETIKNLTFRKNEGFYLSVAGLEQTLFFLGRNMPDTEMLNNVMAVANDIRTNHRKVDYVDINKESAIGHKYTTQ